MRGPVVPGIRTRGLRQSAGHRLSLRSGGRVTWLRSDRGVAVPVPDSGEITKAVVIGAFGDPKRLEVTDVPVPVPARGQVRIATEAIGVGGVDAMIRRGTLAAYGFKTGHLLGSEVAGTVTAVGEGVDTIWVGRRVWAFTGLSGGYAEHAVAQVDNVLPLPSDLTGANAVALGSSGVVAHFALERAHLVPGETVLVRGAAGSIGITAVQIAARCGAGAVAVTTSSSERGVRLKGLGATHVLGRSGEGGPDTLAGFDAVIDVVGGPGLPLFLDKLNLNRRYVAVGLIAGQPPADFGTHLMAAFRKSLSFATFSSDTVPGPQRQAVRAAQFTAAAHGDLRTVVHDVLPLEQAWLAHHRMDAGEVFGRVVLVP